MDEMRMLLGLFLLFNISTCVVLWAKNNVIRSLALTGYFVGMLGLVLWLFDVVIQTWR